MRIYTTILLTAFFLILPTALNAQEETEILLGSYPYNTETVSDEIDKALEKGFIPVGIEVTPGQEIAVLYNIDEKIDANRYILYQFDDVSKFEAEFTEFLKNGWLPMDISFTGDSVFTIFIPSPYEIEGWRLTSTSLDEDEMLGTLSDFRAQGFNPWGISGLDDRLWFLLLSFEDHEVETFFVNFYTTSDEELKEKIKRDLSSGWKPIGLMKRGFSMSILYTR